MYHIGMTQWIVGDELLEVSCKRLQQCGYDGIEFAADPYGLNAEECQIMMKKYDLNCHSLCGIFGEDRDLTDKGENGKRAVQYLKDSVDFAVKVGAELIIVVPSPECGFTGSIWTGIWNTVQKGIMWSRRIRKSFWICLTGEALPPATTPDIMAAT